MLHRADSNISSYYNIASKGAIILATSIWNCNLDEGKSKCNPNWQFKRIDGEKNTISKGYNFRDVNYNVFGNARRLRKLLGVRISICIHSMTDMLSNKVLLGRPSKDAICCF